MNLKIISGGQTGADQGGLLGAQDAGIETCGWAPYKFQTENGSDYSLERFGLKDSCKGYAERTRMNVRDSDYTLWFGDKGSVGGRATERACNQENKPFVVVNGWSAHQIAAFISISNAKVINVAGNRESRAPGLQESTRKIIRDSLFILKDNS